jgi:hypothetical protein
MVAIPKRWRETPDGSSIGVSTLASSNLGGILALATTGLVGNAAGQ